MRFYLTILLLIISKGSLAFVGDENVATLSVLDKQLCNAQVKFFDKALIKKQSLNLSEGVKIEIEQGISTIKNKGARIASNVMCQKLTGKIYTGTDEEWAAYITNGLDGLKKAKATDVKLSLSAGKDMLFPKLNNTREYKVFANLGGNKQVFFNYVLLSKDENTVYSISVSGSIKIKTRIEEEFVRLVKSFNLNIKG